VPATALASDGDDLGCSVGRVEAFDLSNKVFA
jgi:hypothetical protein